MAAPSLFFTEKNTNMAAPVASDVLDGGFLHTHLGPLQWLDELYESSFNHITNTVAQGEQGPEQEIWQYPLSPAIYFNNEICSALPEISAVPAVEKFRKEAPAEQTVAGNV